MSITSEDFRFTHGILSSCGNPQEASQNSGRLKGNMKHWSNYKPPIVFTTERFNEVAKEWETKSRELARLSFTQDKKGRTTMIDKEQFDTLGGFPPKKRRTRTRKSKEQKVTIPQSSKRITSISEEEYSRSCV